ncbi:hypothetical protein ILUMI_24935 [Ignelater luminosus]|uniref:Dipeptidase n=1 Tax=Ignelater luminosus TaxID=2038154 RepID=A0A8K0C5G8_IGNLU|nr:hypothetical protein ILUMI_24935 [Ignelater luminosus]
MKISLAQRFKSKECFVQIKKCFPITRKNAIAASDDSNIEGSLALDNFPLIDGHNDLAWSLNLYKHNQLKNYDFTKDVSLYFDSKCTSCLQTDLPKLKAGKVGAQFWAAYVNCKAQFKDAVAQTLEQIDVIKRLVTKYSEYLQFVTTADGIMQAFKNKKIGSLIGVEGGHQIGNKISVLRTYYELGVRYMTLTHECTTPWADASPLDMSSTNNITEFGRRIILEMNRLGMMVDLSHVSHNVMVQTLDVTKAPVIFSHSSAYKLNAHHRNVRDSVLKKMIKNGGVVMVNFYSKFVSSGNATIKTIVNHINHIVDICGIECVAIGADYNGVVKMPEGLEDVSKYPDLFNLLRELNPKRWTIANLEKLAGRNLLRVFQQVEKVGIEV